MRNVQVILGDASEVSAWVAKGCDSPPMTNPLTKVQGQVGGPRSVAFGVQGVREVELDNSRWLRAEERPAMPYRSLEKFPKFCFASLPALMILPAGTPSLEKAHQHPRLFVESRYMRPFRVPLFPKCDLHCSEEYCGKTIAAYSDLRRSLVYPRLTASIEVEVTATAGGWWLSARAQHGNQESVGGMFGFRSYGTACLYVAAWIGFGRRWIGHSWEDDSFRYRVWATKSIERLDFKLLSADDSIDGQEMTTQSEEAHEVTILEHLFTLQ